MDVSDEARRSPVRLARAPMRLSALAPVFGRAFVHEPMMPLGCDGDLADSFTRCFAYFLEAAPPLGLVWEAGRSEGAAVWIPRRVLGLGRRARACGGGVAAGLDRGEA